MPLASARTISSPASPLTRSVTTPCSAERNVCAMPAAPVPRNVPPAMAAEVS